MLPRKSTQKMPGWAGKTAERERFIDLYRQGTSISEACRLVGVNRKTGTRWVHGRRDVNRSTGQERAYAPIVRVVAESTASGASWFLSEEERVIIADLHHAGVSVRAIAARLERAPSTISRELRRNTLANGTYRPFRAQELARRRRTRPRCSKLALNPRLRGEIQAMMLKRWSPGQITRQLRDLPGRRVHAGRSRDDLPRPLQLARRHPATRVLPDAPHETHQPQALAVDPSPSLTVRIGLVDHMGSRLGDGPV